MRTETNGVIDRCYAPGGTEVGQSSHNEADTDIPIRDAIAYGTIDEPKHSYGKGCEFPGTSQFPEVGLVR